MTRKQIMISWLVAGVLFVLAVFLSTGAHGSETKAQRHEDSVRAATKRYTWQTEACRALPGLGERAVCSAKAQASWKVALALAKAQRDGTRKAWALADREIAEEEARIARVVAAARR